MKLRFFRFCFPVGGATGAGRSHQGRLQRRSEALFSCVFVDPFFIIVFRDPTWAFDFFSVVQWHPFAPFF